MPNTTPTDNTVPPPAGAEWVANWDFDDPDDEVGSRQRLFYGARRVTFDGTRVDIIGTQAGDGTVTERLIIVGHRGDEIAFRTPTEVREAAANMLATADDWEAALAADKQQAAAAMACPLCDGRGDIYETDDAVDCAHVD